MRNVAIVAAVVLIAACKVPDLDLNGKQCPCSDGYVCDTFTNTCVSTIDGGGDDGDGPMFDANLASCLSGGTGALLYGTAFTSGNLQWTEPIGDWGVMVGEAVQTDASLALAYAYPDQTQNETDYRVVAKIRQVNGAGTDAIGLVLRAQPNPPSTGHYACLWEPNTGNFFLGYATSAGATSSLVNVVVDLGAMPGYVPTNPQIIEARVDGTRLECCLRNIAAAQLTFDDNRWTTGGPGFRCDSMSAAFDDLSINALP